MLGGVEVKQKRNVIFLLLGCIEEVFVRFGLVYTSHLDEKEDCSTNGDHTRMQFLHAKKEKSERNEGKQTRKQKNWKIIKE